jgi:hypothetical protein
MDSDCDSDFVKLASFDQTFLRGWRGVLGAHLCGIFPGRELALKPLAEDAAETSGELLRVVERKILGSRLFYMPTCLGQNRGPVPDSGAVIVLDCIRQVVPRHQIGTHLPGFVLLLAETPASL